MLSQQGNAVLQDLYSGFRSRFVDMYPGCNENEVERAFLCAVAIFTTGKPNANLVERIQAIR